MATLVSASKCGVLLFWAGLAYALTRPFGSPLREVLIATLGVVLVAHAVEAWLHARKRGWQTVRRSDLVLILIFGAPHLVAIRLRDPC